jgi:hypothetical protein
VPEHVLDCRSFDLALTSCAGVLNVPAEKLLEALRAFEYAAVPETERHHYPYEELLPKYVCGMGTQQLPPPDLVHWFHATRVLPGTDFRDGVLPLRRRLDSIWMLLESLASDWTTPAEWRHFRRNMQGPGAQQYQLKISSSLHDGPYAFLVRDAILQPRDLWSHDYLDMPEIIEDICQSYQQVFARPLYERVQAATRACIVTFRSTEPRPDAVAAALMYVHRLARREDLFLHCNTCYDGKGIPIPARDLVGVEWPEGSEA